MLDPRKVLLLREETSPHSVAKIGNGYLLSLLDGDFNARVVTGKLLLEAPRLILKSDQLLFALICLLGACWYPLLLDEAAHGVNVAVDLPEPLSY